MTKLIISEYTIVDIILSEDFNLYGENAYSEDLKVLDKFNSSNDMTISINNKSYKEEYVDRIKNYLIVEEYGNQKDILKFSSFNRLLISYENTIQDFIDFTKDIAVVYNTKRNEILESLKNKKLLIDKDHNIYEIK
jgi:hypothetical protein